MTTSVTAIILKRSTGEEEVIFYGSSVAQGGSSCSKLLLLIQGRFIRPNGANSHVTSLFTDRNVYFISSVITVVSLKNLVVPIDVRIDSIIFTFYIKLNHGKIFIFFSTYEVIESWPQLQLSSPGFGCFISQAR